MLFDTKSLTPGTAQAEHLYLDQAVFGIIVVFGCFNVFEKGMAEWPAYVSATWRLEAISYPRWLFIDFVYELVLLAAFFAYRANRERYLFIGMGVLAFGAFMALFHLIITIGYLNYAPGVISAVCGFVPLAVLGMKKARAMGRLTPATVAGAGLTGLAIFLLPYLIIVHLAGRA